MNFLTPLAFALAALLPVIVALYFLKLRRTEKPVASTYLWRTLVRDTAANAPWQRLKPNLLLLLQLLFLAALIFALARPFVWSSAVANSHLILVFDTSASMSAADVSPNRLGNAVAQARDLVSKLPSDARVSVIEAGARVRVPVSSATDKNSVFAALDALRPGLGGTDMASALTLTAALAAQEPDAQVLLFSDGHFDLAENVVVPAHTQFISVGTSRENQALGTFTLQPAAVGPTLDAFVQMTNYGTAAVTRRLVLSDENGRLVTARDVNLVPGKSQAITLPDLAVDSGALQARLEGSDALLLDDRAWAVAPLREKTSVRVITNGNRFLETALALLPGVEITTSKPDDLTAPAVPPALTIFDSVVPTATLPTGNLLFIAPPRATEFFSVTGQVRSPLPVAVTADDPVLRYVDLTDVAVEDASQIALPAWGHAVLTDSRTGAPLLVVGEQDGRHLGILTFDVRHSDLPLRVAFPLLMANLLDALVPGGGAGMPASVEPGRAVTIASPPQATALVIRTPDGVESVLSPEQGRAVFNQTDIAGVYRLFARDSEGKTEPLGHFAVNGSTAESDIVPRADLTLTSAVVANAGGTERARDEWWQPLAWAALVLLVVEWLVAYRGQLQKLFNFLSRVISTRSATSPQGKGQ